MIPLDVVTCGHMVSNGPYKDRLNRSQQSKVIYKACCWDCDDFYIGETKRRLHDRKTEHFKALAKTDNTSAVADHVKTTGHNIKWDHFEILAKFWSLLAHTISFLHNASTIRE